MHSFEEHERYIRVAVKLLQTQDPRAILMLKNFLTYIPSPTSIRHILAIAVIKLIDISPPSILWLLRHPECLQPEVNTGATVMQNLSERLTDLGFVQGQDFYVEDEQRFEVNEAAKLALSTQSQILNIQDPLPIIDYLQNR